MAARTDANDREATWAGVGDRMGGTAVRAPGPQRTQPKPLRTHLPFHLARACVDGRPVRCGASADWSSWDWQRAPRRPKRRRYGPPPNSVQQPRAFEGLPGEAMTPALWEQRRTPSRAA